MKKLDLGQTITILANVGVIAGIIFLAIEIRQNNSLLASQASYAQFSVERERRTRFLENRSGLMDITIRARLGEELTRTEAGQLNAQWRDILDSWQWQFREYQAGRLEIEVMSNVADWRALWRLDGGLQETYRVTVDQRDADFLRFMEENVINER